MSVKTPQELYNEAQQSLGYHVAANLLTIVSLPVKLVTKIVAVVGAWLAKTRANHEAEASKS